MRDYLKLWQSVYNFIKIDAIEVETTTRTTSTETAQQTTGNEKNKTRDVLIICLSVIFGFILLCIIAALFGIYYSKRNLKFKVLDDSNGPVQAYGGITLIYFK